MNSKDFLSKLNQTIKFKSNDDDDDDGNDNFS